MATVSVTIDGKTYRMACDEGQEQHLTGLAQQLDQYISHLKSNFGEIGDHRLSVMAGIMVMDELAETQRQMDIMKRENEELRQENAKLATVGERYEVSIAKTIDKAASHIETLASQLIANR
ncbi:cell division protein ZapA [Bartonella sp. LJL80]